MPRPHWSTFARGKRKQRGQMNQLETAYASHLDGLKTLGQVEWWGYEVITLTISHGVSGGEKGSRITVDFLVLTAAGVLQVHEVKGFREARQVNALKAAAELFPFQFFLVERRLKRDGGGWNLSEV